MCVIIYKPAGENMPANYIIEAAFVANPHGAGFVTPGHIYKTMSVEQLKKQLAKVDDSEPCIMHFRLATHGSICKSNCHPFKRGDIAMAHNGILGVEPMGDWTDSETALHSIFYPVAETFGFNSDEFDTAVNAVIGSSRFAFMHGREVRLFGQFVKQGAYYFSNLNFMRVRYYF